MASTAAALTVAERAERSAVAVQLSERSQALLSLLPDEAAVRRFQRVTLQALAKNPDLMECTPDSVVTAVMEAAAMGLEPTGAIGGAHLVPFNVNTGSREHPRWEKRAQLIPDFRGVVRLLTRPRSDGSPSEVLSVEARTVKEGDEFAYTLGTDATLSHVPALSPNRSEKPTTHVYAIARLRSGATQSDVMDRAEVERIRQRGKKKGISPWDTDWDEMARKTVVKRLAKLLPVEPEARSILAREDDPEETPAPAPLPVAPGTPATARLAARLRPEPPEVAPEPAPEPAAPPAGPAGLDEVDADAVWREVDGKAPAAVPDELDAEAFTAFLEANRISVEYARAAAESMFGKGTRLSAAQRAELARELTKES